MAEPKHVTERMVRRGDINMRLITNSLHGHLRFMDFRVGHYEQKRAYLDEIAAAEGLHKVFTLVEKQDSQNWRQVEFSREGVYPGFFRTADAYVMSRLYDEAGRPLPPAPPAKRPEDPPPVSENENAKANGLKLDVLEGERAVAEFLGTLDSEIGALPFGRAHGPDLVLQGRTRAGAGWACAEIDDSFGHAMVVFSRPEGWGKDAPFCRNLADHLLETLLQREVNNVFGLTAEDDEVVGKLYMDLGFRVTGKLARHLQTDSGVTPALVWHRRINTAR